MIILTVRTDNPEAEIGVYKDNEQLAYETWHAHRQLAETLHTKIHDILSVCGLKLQEVDAIACYRGPGSFTGLRIGLSVVNALGYALGIPIVSEIGEDWQEKSFQRVLRGDSEKIVSPEYGADVNITRPRNIQ